MEKEKKYFKLTCVNKERFDRHTKQDIYMLANAAAAIYKYKETIVMDEDLIVAEINKEGTVKKINPYYSHFMGAFSDYIEEEERVGYMGENVKVAAVKTLFDIPQNVKNPPVFFKIKSKFDNVKDVYTCISAAYNEDGVRTSFGVIDRCDVDEAIWAKLYAIEGSDHLVAYCNIDSSDQDAPITYKYVIIDTTDKTHHPIKFSSPTQENLSVEENGCIYSKMIDGSSGKRCLMALDTKEWKMEWIEMSTYEQAAGRMGMNVPQYRQYRKEKGHIL